MKRFCALLLILFICVSLFSAVLTSTSYTYTVKGSSAKNSIEVGFSTIPIDTWEITAVNPTVYPLVVKKDPSTGDIYASNELYTLYLYWRMVTTKPITINMKLDGNMVYEASSETVSGASVGTDITDATPLSWELSWLPRSAKAQAGENGTQEKAGNTFKNSDMVKIVPGDAYKKVESFPAQSTALSVFGYVPVVIKTGSLKERVIGGSYIGTVAVQVVTV